MSSHEQRSSFTAWLGGRRLQSEEGSVVLDFMVREEMLNPFGTLHGGCMAAIMLEAMKEAARDAGADRADHYSIVNFHAEFLSRVRRGAGLHARTETRTGHAVLNFSCTLTTHEGVLVGKSSATAVRK